MCIYNCSISYAMVMVECLSQIFQFSFSTNFSIFSPMLWILQSGMIYVKTIKNSDISNFLFKNCVFSVFFCQLKKSTVLNIDLKQNGVHFRVGTLAMHALSQIKSWVQIHSTSHIFCIADPENSKFIAEIEHHFQLENHL